MNTALVTGGLTRLGNEISVFLKDKEYLVQNHYNSSAQATIKDLQADFTNNDDLKVFLSRLKECDVLINNAALFENDDVKNISQRSLSNHLKVNLEAPILIASKLISLNSNVKIINILDAWVHDLPGNFTSYALSKLALTEATKLLAKQANVYGIQLGFTLHKPEYPKDFFNKMQEKYPSSPEDVCKAIEFILDGNVPTGTIIDLTKWKA